MNTGHGLPLSYVYLVQWRRAKVKYVHSIVCGTLSVTVTGNAFVEAEGPTDSSGRGTNTADSVGK